MILTRLTTLVEAICVLSSLSVLASSATRAETSKIEASIVFRAESPNDENTHLRSGSVRFWELPGLANPAFGLQDGSDIEFIDSEGHVSDYQGMLPNVSFLDENQSEHESWSGRWIAWTWSPISISILKPGSDGYTLVPRSNDRERLTVHGVFPLPRRKISVALFAKGPPMILDGSELRSWSEADPTLPSIPAIFSIQDAPSLSGSVLFAHEGRMLILSDDNKLSDVGSMRPDDFGPLFDAWWSRTSVFLGQHEVVAINKNTDILQYRTQMLANTDNNEASTTFVASRMFGQLLHYESTGNADPKGRWQRLGLNGLEDIVGGRIGNSSLWGPRAAAHESLILHRIVLQGRDGLYAYDGKQIELIPESDPEMIGLDPWFQDLSALGHVVARSKKGYFDVTLDGLHKIEMPEGFGHPEAAPLTNWPAASLALAPATDALYTLDTKLRLRPMPLGPAVMAGRTRVMGVPGERTTSVLVSDGVQVDVLTCRPSGP